MDDEQKILAVNPGSTSSKIAFFAGSSSGVREIMSRTIEHDRQELESFDSVVDQKDLRLEYIIDFIEESEIELENLDAVVGRGGLLKPIPGGTYAVNEAMLSDLKSGRQGEHASNLGGILASELAEKSGAEPYIVDPVVVDEMKPIARISGMPELERRSIFHALNQKAVARKYAAEKDKNYDEITIIAAHLGGGISVGLHEKGKVTDVNNALAGEGPFTPNRAGTLPALDLAMFCISSGLDETEMKQKLTGESGVMGYLGTNDMKEVEKRAAGGDDEAKLIFDAMVYQVAKEIASLAPAAEEPVEAILLTGGIAHSSDFVTGVEERVEFIAPVHLYPGEEEMKSLAEGANRVLMGQESARQYE